MTSLLVISVISISVIFLRGSFLVDSYFREGVALFFITATLLATGIWAEAIASFLNK